MSKASAEKEGGEHATSRVVEAEHVVGDEVRKAKEQAKKSAEHIENTMKELSHMHVSRKEDRAKMLILFHHPHLDKLRLMFESQRYDGCIASIVFFNLVLIVVETDCEGRGLPVPSWVDTMNSLILIAFVCEVAIKVCVYQKSFIHMFWNVLDFTIVGIDIFSMILSATVGDMPTMSVFRIVRLVRLTRSVKFLNMFPELGLMLSALRGAMSSLLWGLVLLLLALLIVAIMTVQIINPINQEVASRGVYEGCERCPHAFESVWMSLLTVWQTDIAGDSWGLVALPISEEAPATWFVFVAVLVMLQLLMLNVILAAVLDSAQQARLENVEIMAKEREQEMHKFRKQLLVLCAELDEDKSGSLTHNEIIDGFKSNTEFFDIMESMDILPEDIASVWGILDRNHNGKVDYEEFASELFKIKSEDIHTMMVFIKYQVAEIRETVQSEMTKLAQQTDMLNTLTHKKAEMLTQITAITATASRQITQSDDVKDNDNSQNMQVVGSEDNIPSSTRPENDPNLTSSRAEPSWTDHVREKLDRLANVRGDVEEPKLDTSMNTMISLEINALKVDLSQAISEKSRFVEDKIDATRQLIDALIEAMPRQGVAMLDPVPGRVSLASTPQVQSDPLPVQLVTATPSRTTTPSRFRCIPAYCCSGASGSAPPSSVLAIDSSTIPN